MQRELAEPQGRLGQVTRSARRNDRPQMTLVAQLEEHVRRVGASRCVISLGSPFKVVITRAGFGPVEWTSS